jgi:hypothetical protein
LDWRPVSARVNHDKTIKSGQIARRKSKTLMAFIRGRQFDKTKKGPGSVEEHTTGGLKALSAGLNDDIAI